MPVQAENPVIQVYRGDSLVKTFKFYQRDVDDPETLLPLDLTPYGSSWRAQLRKSADDSVVTDFAIDASDADTGIIVVSLTSEQTSLLPAKGVWDLQVTDTAQDPPFVRTMVYGTFERTKDVSRP